RGLRERRGDARDAIEPAAEFGLLHDDVAGADDGEDSRVRGEGRGEGVHDDGVTELAGGAGDGVGEDGRGLEGGVEPRGGDGAPVGELRSEAAAGGLELGEGAGGGLEAGR